MTRGQQIRQLLRLGGTSGLALYTFDWAMNRWCSWSIHRCLKLNEAQVELPTGMKVRQVNAEEAGVLLRPLTEAVDGAYIENARRNRDSCYLVVKGETVAHFTWFATQPTLVDPNWRLEIPEGTLYKYNAFTFPEFRGRRLDSYVSSRALVDFRSRGFTRLICLVPHTNFPSLRSNARLGAQVLGSMLLWRRGGWSKTYVSRSLRQTNIRISAAGELQSGDH